jgi:hypothetical protein
VSSIFNKREAFKKCAETKEFKAWHRVETLKRLGQLKDIDRIVDEQMQEKNIKVEYITGQ